MLNEQSRMAKSICSAVSEAFYLGKLKVADNSKDDTKWLKKRSIKFASVDEKSSLAAIDIHSDGIWSQKYRGLIRFESAQQISELVNSALKAKQINAEDIIILTPFRAQRVLIRALLFHHGIKGVRVSTVHRSQGSEALVILFDPVKGDEPFLANEQGARLINVAVSRAMGKLILFLSSSDKKNEKLAQFYQLSKGTQSTSTNIEPLSMLLKRVSNLDSVVGQTVSHGRHVGTIKTVNTPPGILVLLSHVTGLEHRFQMSHIK